MYSGLISGSYYGGLVGLGVLFGNHVYEYGEDYFYTQEIRGEYRGPWTKNRVRYNAKGRAYIMKKGRRVFLDEVMRW